MATDRRDTMKLRWAIRNRKFDEIYFPQGRYVDEYVNLPDGDEQTFQTALQNLSEIFQNSNFTFIDYFHEHILFDIFVSEIATDMSNNIADYVSNPLLLERYKVAFQPPIKARSKKEIEEYIANFNNSSQLLKNIVGVELDRFCQGENHLSEMHFYEKGKTSPRVINVREITDCLLNRGTETNITTDLEEIVDSAFLELFFAVRQNGNLRFSVAASFDHTVALCSILEGNKQAIKRIKSHTHRFTSSGQVIPSWSEYFALFMTFTISTIIFAVGIWQNWANRTNMLEKVFDGVGLFGIVTGVLLGIISRRLDFYDLAGIIFQRKRFLESYGELISILQLSDNEVKNAITFEDVYLAPLGKGKTSYAFNNNCGVFDPFSGLDTTEKNLNIIVGNELAISRGENSIKYYTVLKSAGDYFLKSAADGKFRITAEGDSKTVI